MNNIAYYNGKTDAIEKMEIPITDRACWFGDGIYEAALAVGDKIFALDEHLDRMTDSADAVDIKLPLKRQEIADILYDLAMKVEGDCKLVYWQISRAGGPRMHGYDRSLKANFWSTVRPIDLPNKNKILSLITTCDKRYSMCNIKTLNLLPNILAMQKAADAGCDEAVLCRDGIVTECSHSNIQILKNGKLITHPADNFILPGVARKHLLDHCAKLEIPIMEKSFTRDEMFEADEIIVSSTGQICLKADKIDGKSVGGKDPQTFNALQKSLFGEFNAAVGKI